MGGGVLVRHTVVVVVVVVGSWLGSNALDHA